MKINIRKTIIFLIVLMAAVIYLVLGWLKNTTAITTISIILLIIGLVALIFVNKHFANIDHS